MPNCWYNPPANQTHGEVPEWLNGTVSKTVVVPWVTVGSNPTLSAHYVRSEGARSPLRSHGDEIAVVKNQPPPQPSPKIGEGAVFNLLSFIAGLLMSPKPVNLSGADYISWPARRIMAPKHTPIGLFTAHGVSRPFLARNSISNTDHQAGIRMPHPNPSPRGDGFYAGNSSAGKGFFYPEWR